MSRRFTGSGQDEPRLTRRGLFRSLLRRSGAERAVAREPSSPTPEPPTPAEAAPTTLTRHAPTDLHRFLDRLASPKTED
jgi:hypothetical protein